MSKETEIADVVLCCEQAARAFGCSRFIVREHPNRPLSRGEKRRLGAIPGIEVARPRPLEDDVGRCGLVIAGDSSVHLEVLLRGCPSLYGGLLENASHDSYDFLRDGLLLVLREGLSLKEVNRHYQHIDRDRRLNDFVNVERSREESNREFHAFLDEK